MFRVSPPGTEPSRDTLPSLIEFSWFKRSGGADWRAVGGRARDWFRLPGASGGWLSGARATSKDVLHPVFILGRGGRKASARAAGWWKAADWAKRRAVVPALLIVLVLALKLPYGLVLVALTVLALLAWFGWERVDRKALPEAQATKLQNIYDALVPYLGVENDPDGLFKPGNAYDKAFSDAVFCEEGHLTGLKISYPKYFKVTESGERQQVERAIAYMAGGPNPYHVRWDPAEKKLHVVALLTAQAAPAEAGGGAAAPVLAAAGGGEEHTLVLQEVNASGGSIESVPAVPVD
jgi:hypothetical protein